MAQYIKFSAMVTAYYLWPDRKKRLADWQNCHLINIFYRKKRKKRKRKKNKWSYIYEVRIELSLLLLFRILILCIGCGCGQWVGRKELKRLACHHCRNPTLSPLSPSPAAVSASSFISLPIARALSPSHAWQAWPHTRDGLVTQKPISSVSTSSSMFHALFSPYYDQNCDNNSSACCLFKAHLRSADLFPFFSTRLRWTQS